MTKLPEIKLKESAIKSTCHMARQHPESQIFVRFALRLAVFEIFHILGFPID